MFEIKEREGLARIGKFEVRGKVIETPTIFVVYNPNIPTIKPAEIKKLGLPIITSSYILWKTKREEVIKKGLHDFLGFDGVVMTDSGAFQAYQYKDVELTNESVIDFQKKINTDIGVILDLIVGFEENKQKAKEMVDETIRRARELFALGKGSTLWAGPIQGGKYMDLVAYCARKMAEMNFDLYCIGSVVPALDNYWFDVVINQILTAKQQLPLSKPVHLFGAGHPLIFSLAVLLGIDLFDSAYYALAAKRGKYLLQTGHSFNINEMRDVACTCPVCTSYSIREFTERELALHNLYVIAEELKTIKQAIYEKRLWELVEQRIRSHPSMIKAYLELRKYKKFLDKFEPASRLKGTFYFDDLSTIRPTFRLAARKARRVKSKRTFRWLKYDIPHELRYTYPFAQTISPETTSESWENKERVKNIDSEEEAIEIVRAVILYQYGVDVAPIFKTMNLHIEFSKVSGAIRRIYDGDKLLGTMRAQDGLFVPTLYFFMRVESLFGKDYVVVVDKVAEPFVKDGRNVFAKFVVKSSGKIRSGDEVMVKTTENELIGCGTALMTPDEMMEFERGVAVNTRDYLHKYRAS